MHQKHLVEVMNTNKASEKPVESITAKIMEEASIEHLSLYDIKKPTDNQHRSKFSVELEDSNERGDNSLRSLNNVEKLWNSICLEFKLPTFQTVMLKEAPSYLG